MALRKDLKSKVEGESECVTSIAKRCAIRCSRVGTSDDIIVIIVCVKQLFDQKKMSGEKI